MKQYRVGSIKNLIVFCAGAFAEINENSEKLNKTFGKDSGGGECWAYYSPLLYTDRKGGALRIMLQQF